MLFFITCVCKVKSYRFCWPNFGQTLVDVQKTVKLVFQHICKVKKGKTNTILRGYHPGQIAT